MAETSPPTTENQRYVGWLSEGLTLVVSAAGFSLFLYGAAFRRDHFSDFALFWLLSGAATPSVRLPRASPRIRVVDWIGMAAGALSLAVGIFFQPPFLFVGITFCFSAWGSIVDRRSARLGRRPAWRLLLSLVALASLCIWLWYVLYPSGAP